MDKVVEFLQKRIEWLEKERRNGGDYKHLTTRMEESQYILGRITPFLKQTNIIESMKSEYHYAGDFHLSPNEKDENLIFKGKNTMADRVISIIQEAAK